MMGDEPGKSHRDRLGCILWAIGLPVVLLAVLVLVFLHNNRPPVIKLPPHPMPKINGWDDFKRAERLVNTNYRHRTMADYHAFLKANAAALAAVRSGLRKPYMHPDILSLPLIPMYCGVRSLGRVLVREALYYERVGRWASAASSRLDCIELGVVLPTGGGLAAGSEGAFIESIGYRQFGRVLRRLNAAELARVARRLEHIAARRVSFVEIVREDSYRTAADMEGWLRRDGPLGTALSADEWQVGPSLWQRTRFALANKTTMVREAQAYLLAVAREQEAAYLGVSRVPQPNAFAGMFGGSDMNGGPYALDWRAGLAEAEARQLVFQTEVALLRYHADHGRYPARLSALVPEYLKSISVDPCGGKPLKYRALNGGTHFLLYSIGPDLKDDGGKWKGTDAPPPDIVAGRL